MIGQEQAEAYSKSNLPPLPVLLAFRELHLTKSPSKRHKATVARTDVALTNPRGLVCGIDEGEDDGRGNRGSRTRPLQ
jgi:hypothetical protein